MTTAATIADTLDRIPDPASGKGLIVSGRLAPPRFADGIATLVLDTSAMVTPAADRLAREVEAAVRAMPGVTDVRLVRTAETQPRRLIAVASGKGGVGKSTVAANLAVALAAAGRDVGLIDADIAGPSIPTLLGLAGTRAAARDKRLIPSAAHGVKALSTGMLVEPDVALAWRGPMQSGALQQMIEADWGETGLVVLDLPPGTGDIQLSIVQKWKPVGAVIVSTPQDLALIDARRAIDLFVKTGVPILGLVENMSGYVCPACGDVSHPFGSGAVEEQAARLGVPFLGRVPLDIAVREASDEGRPVALEAGPRGQAFRDIATKVGQAIG